MKNKMIKTIANKNYIILFDTETGMEITSGINGHEDPFSLYFPCMLDIGIMGHCENKCSICYQGDKDQPNMTLDGFKRIINETKKLVNQCALGGRGDPELHEHYKEIVSYCRENEVVPNFTTSGRKLTKEKVEIAKEFCGAVAVSDYSKDFTFEAIKLLQSYEMKTNIHIVVTSESVDKCIQIAKGEDVWNKKVNRDKLNAVIFLLFKPQGRGKNLIHLVPSDDKIKLFLAGLRESKSPFKLGMDSCLVNKIMSLKLNFTKKEQVFLDTCEAGRKSAYISPDLKFMPCSFADHDEWGVDISKRSMVEVWKNAPPFLKARNLLSKNPSNCPFDFT